MKETTIVEEFIKNNQWEAVEFYKGIVENSRLAHLSYDLLLKGKEESENQILEVIEEKKRELEDNCKSELYVDDIKRMNPEIIGIKVSPGLFFKKHLGEIVHYSRIVFDMYMQIVNNCILLRHINQERVSQSTIKKYLEESFEDNEAANYWLTIIDEPLYKYIQELDNYIKHNHVIPVKTSVNTNYKYNVEFDSFIRYRNQYEKVDAIKRASEIIKYIDETNATFIKKLYNSLVPFRNRISDVPFISYRKKDNKLAFVAFFIDVDTDELDVEKEFGDETIEVYPMLYNNGRVYEDRIFKCDRLFLRIRGTKDEVVGVAITDNELRKGEYPAYKVRPCKADEYDKYKQSFVKEIPDIKFNTVAHLGIEYRVASDNRLKQKNINKPVDILFDDEKVYLPEA